MDTRLFQLFHNPDLFEKSFRFAYQNLDEFKIKERVDKLGIHRYIDYCAVLAAGTGAAAGSGGAVTLAFGIPADLANSVMQQFRVTLAVIYHRTGRYQVSFPEFMRIVGLSLGLEAGALGLRVLLVRIAQQVTRRLTAQSAGRVVPLVGAVIGGGVNYAFIKSQGTALLRFDELIFQQVLEEGTPPELTERPAETGDTPDTDDGTRDADDTR